MTPPIFYWFNRVILLKITANVYAPIHFAHAFHVHAKYYLDDIQTILQGMYSCFEKYIL